MKIKNFLTICLLIATVTVFLCLTACTDKKTEKTLTPDRDVAETTAGAVSFNTGGVVDQLSDLCEFLVADTTKFSEVLLKDSSEKWESINKTYNYETGYWTINLERVRGDTLTIPNAHLFRKYTLRFLNVAGNPQKYYVTDADTARTVNFSIKRGWGEFKTRRISQVLDSLTADWTVTDANLPLVTINGTYYRAAVDTISGFNKVRTSDHWLELNFNDIEVPRGHQTNFYLAVSGSLTGLFHADITFSSGTAYSETTIDRNINVVFGQGRGNIALGTTSFKADLSTGELIN
jgi:hypothetical protein